MLRWMTSLGLTRGLCTHLCNVDGHEDVFRQTTSVHAEQALLTEPGSELIGVLAELAQLTPERLLVPV